MAKSTGSLVFLFIFPLLCNNLGGHVKFAYGLEAQKSWCVAKASSSDSTLQNNIEYACSILGDCKMIQPGGSCFDPNNLFNHASVVMNQYYAFSGGNGWNCYFSGSGLIVVSDPSYDNCKYA
ncbi:major pollen allergen Ole e 10-like isoform X2 [Vigna unguiculata]|uniref:Histidine kinase 2/3/4 n=1 Tax=Vigna unguiculata TaxID=3917 RepID=A0A4D6L5U8_VIGUN|nr:major pollen allergen Ole e 10-like isoform X2 [Vigna unguiculata]QCD83897.1 histidine kinase 2/3/4 [Vigna unguiculata]